MLHGFDTDGTSQGTMSIDSSVARPNVAAGPDGEVYYFRSTCSDGSDFFCDDPFDEHVGEIHRLDFSDQISESIIRVRTRLKTPWARWGRTRRRYFP